jgi:hypothetical protein
MKHTVTEHDFVQAFNDVRPDNFSYAGLQALFENIEDLESGSDMEIELDVIAICCDFTEYENLAEFHGVYDKADYPDYESIQDATMIIQSDYYTAEGEEWGNKSFIIQDF